MLTKSQFVLPSFLKASDSRSHAPLFQRKSVNLPSTTCMVSWPEEVADALLDVAGAGAACAAHPSLYLLLLASKSELGLQSTSRLSFLSCRSSAKRKENFATSLTLAEDGEADGGDDRVTTLQRNQR